MVSLTVPIKPVLLSGIGRQSSGVGSPNLSSGVEGKIVPVRVMKACRGSGGIVPLILNFGTRRGVWAASRFGRFTPWKEPGTHWFGLRAGQDVVLR